MGRKVPVNEAGTGGVDPGRYTAHIHDYSFDTSQFGDGEYIKWKMNIHN